QAANFLIAPNETAANAALAEINEVDAKTRYVVVDWQMVNGKFGAPVTFYTAGNVTRSDFRRTIYRTGQQGGIQPVGQINTQRYYESMMVRLYRFHGSAVSPSRIGSRYTYVTDWKIERVQTPQGRTIPIRVVPDSGQVVRRFESPQTAKAFVENDTTSQMGGIGNFPVERVSALDHYRQVKVNEYQSGGRTRYPGVKVFERVPGATVEGTGPPNQTVVASVEMNVPSRNTTFTYRQYAQTGADGTFEMTLPYSSTGYENWGVEEGYTNVSIRATGPYQFSTGVTIEDNLTRVRYTDTAHVQEGQVIGENETAVRVDLEREVLQQPEGAGNSSATNTTNTTETTDAETNTTETTNSTDATNATETTSTTDGTTTTTATTTTSAAVAPAHRTGDGSHHVAPLIG
ncbi:MAG: dolichyl-diphosphooligosaccharide--protein glycosyltransferase, partial [Halanaeroarchaeum sp.]